MKLQSISVTIPNYNGRLLLEEILPFLFTALSKSGLPYEVIIVDDFSSDDSVAFLKDNYPEIILILNDSNKGFSPTVNKGIFAAKYSHVLILNSDVKLSENYFEMLPRYFEKEDTFGVMGRIIGWSDNKIQDGGKFPGFHGAKIKTSGNYEPQEATGNDWFYSMYLSGANALIAKDKIIALGGFDEIFAPFYVEDYELSLRAWRLGYKCYYEHNAVCRHKVSVSIKSKNSKDYVNAIYYRNKMYLHAMHLEGMNLFLWYIQLIPETLIRFFTLRFYYFRSLKLFFKSRLRMKRSVEQFRKVSHEKGELLSVKEVVGRIKDSLIEKNIRRF